MGAAKLAAQRSSSTRRGTVAPTTAGRAPRAAADAVSSLQSGVGNAAIADLFEAPTAATGEEVSVQRGVLDDLSAAAGSVLNRVKQGAAGAASAVKSTGRDLLSGLAQLAGRIGSRVSDVGSALLGKLRQGWSALERGATSLWDKVSSVAGRAWDGIGSFLKNGLEGLRGLWSRLKQGVGGFVGKLISRAKALLASMKKLGSGMFGGSAAKCVGPEEVAKGRGALAREQASATATLEGESAAGIAAADGQATGIEAQSAGLAAKVDANLAAEAGRLDAGTQQVTGELGAGSARLVGEGAAGLESTKAAAAQGETQLDSQGGSGAQAVVGQADAAVGGLRGLVGGFASVIGGVVEQMFGGVKSTASGLAGSLKSRASELGESLKAKAGAVLAKVTDGIAELRRGLEAIGNRIRDAAAKLWARLQAVGAELKARAAAAAGKLRSAWGWLKQQAGKAWSSIKERLAKLAARAGIALDDAECDTCTFNKAAAEGRKLIGEDVPSPAMPAAPAVNLKPSGGSGQVRRSAAAVVAGFGPGQPLDVTARGRMESAFGVNLAHVRVHTSARAGAVADEHAARAVTVGNRIAFGAGEYRPGSPVGDALLAHEVAHVVQQAGSSHRPQAKSVDADSGFELDADRSAIAAVARLWLGLKVGASDIAGAALPRLRSGLQLRRCSKCCEDKEKLPTGALTIGEVADPGQPNPMPLETLQNHRKKDDANGGRILGVTMLSSETHGFMESIGNAEPTKAARCDSLCEVPKIQEPPFRLSPYIYLKEGKHQIDTRQVKSGPCKGKRPPRFLNITPEVATRIKLGERMHAQDDMAGYKRTTAKFAAAVRELSSGYCGTDKVVGGANQQAGIECVPRFKELMGERTGIPRTNWVAASNCAQVKSVEKRDESGNHTVDLFGKTSTETVADDCSEVVITPSAAGLGLVDVPKPEEVVAECPGGK